MRGAAAADGCPLLLILVSPGICAELIKHFGTAEQRERWLPPIGAGEKMVFAITEPDAGSNSHNLATTATRDGDVVPAQRLEDLHLRRRRGRRRWSWSRGPADDATAGPGRAQLSLFIVDTDAPGSSAR